MKPKIQISQVVIHVAFVIISLLMIMPFALVVMVSLTSEDSIVKHGYQFLPKVFSLDAYRYVLQTPDIILRAYGITAIITIAGTLCGLLITAMTAYVISRKDYRYNRITTFYVFFTMLFSGGFGTRLHSHDPVSPPEGYAVCPDSAGAAVAL